MYIFLDIDGVLVKEDKPGEQMDTSNMEMEDVFQFDHECHGLFEATILKHDHARIVISSSWIEVCPLDTIKALFSTPVAARVVGATPRQAQAMQYFRHREVLDYIAQNGLDNIPWIAIDDIQQHFPPDAPVLVTNPYAGFGQADARRLDYFLSHGSLPEL